MANEKRLIDVNVLIDRIKQEPTDGMYTHEILNVIAEQLTVDAVEVVHGEWVVCGDGEYVPFMCSACGKTTSWYHAQTANFCPNCGAKMDGGVK